MERAKNRTSGRSSGVGRPRRAQSGNKYEQQLIQTVREVMEQTGRQFLQQQPSPIQPVEPIQSIQPIQPLPEPKQPDKKAELPLGSSRFIYVPAGVEAPSRKLRVMLVLDQFNIGGTETHCLTLARYLLRYSSHVVVVGKEGPMMDSFVALGCPVYPVDFVDHEFLMNKEQEVSIMNRLKAIMRDEEITLVHIHQIPSGQFACRAAEEMRIPMIFTAHGLYYEEDMSQILAKSSAAVCVSPAVWTLLHQHTEIPLHVIPNGIDTVEFDSRPTLLPRLREGLGITGEGPVVMYAGRITWEKATICQDVIRACKTLRDTLYPGLHLLVVGTGSQHRVIYGLAEQLQGNEEQPFLHIIGPSLNMCAYYSISDCLIGTGRTAVEALASRCPVIAVGVQGFFGRVRPDNLNDAWACWFGDHQAERSWSEELLLSEIDETLKLSFNQRKEHSWICRKYVFENFEINKVAAKLASLYKETLDTQGSY